MTTNNTGVLDFYWPAVGSADFYGVKFYINNTPSSFVTTSQTGYQLTGLSEGDLVGGEVHTSINDQFIDSVHSFTPQYYDVYNFHDINQNLSFSGFQVDGIDLSIAVSGNTFIASGVHYNYNAIIDLDIATPRDNSIIQYFTEEPFLTGIKYREIDNLTDTTPFTQVNTFSFVTENPKNNRNFITQVVLEDFYGSGVTGNIYLENNAISLQSISKTQFNSGSGYFNVFSAVYSNTSEYAEYSFYENSSFTGTPFLTGYTNTPNDFSIELPLGVTGYFELLPYDWFGSGHAFHDTDYFYSENIEYITSEDNQFLSILVDNNDVYGEISIIPYHSEVSNTGSSILLSIDSGSGSSFDGGSYFTGQIANATEHTFNYFDHLDPNNFQTLGDLKLQPFFLNFKLLQENSSYIEDVDQVGYEAVVPSIVYDNIILDYQVGLTTVEFDSYPTFNQSGIDILISGKNDNNYSLFSGYNFSTGALDYHVDIRLVNSDNYSLIYDDVLISGSGIPPSVNHALTNFSQSDASLHFDLTAAVNSSPINYTKMYGKYTFSASPNTGEEDFLDDDFLEILDFNDYQNYFLNNVDLGINMIQAPSGIDKNKTYQHTGIFPTGFGTGFFSGDLFTGHYESGSHFMYRFVPYNGYGSGYATDVIFYNFPRNANTESQQDAIDDLNDKVSSLENSAVSMHSDSVFIPSGDCSIEVDYTIAEFTDVPHIVGTLSTHNQEDPILGLILSGDPTTASATFILSDQVDSTGYQLKYLASENII